MWTLVYFVFIGGALESTVIDTYTTMYECFDNREMLSFDVGGQDGYYPAGSQAVCVYQEEIKI